MPSKSLLVNSNINVKESDKEESSTMLLLMNAVAEAKNKNYKKCAVEFNQSLVEAESAEHLLLSKLLELELQDLEILYQALCSGERSRRSSKQQEKKGSFKKKLSVDDGGFSNGAYEGELRSSTSSTSIGRKRSQTSLSGENIPGKSCLRKAYSLAHDMLKSETQNEAFTNIVNIHLKAENYYSCTVYCIEFKEKPIVEKFLCTLDDSQTYKISQVCLFIASKDTRPDNIGHHSFNAKSRLEYSKLAYKLQPNSMKTVETLCKLYRVNNETEKAHSMAKTFLEEIDSKCEAIVLLEIMCLLDKAEYENAKSNLRQALKDNDDGKQLKVVEAILYILEKETNNGIEIITNMGINENKMLLVTTLDLLKLDSLQVFVVQLLAYLTRRMVGGESEITRKEEEEMKTLNELKSLLSVSGQLLSLKSSDNLQMAKIYIDCLYICGSLDEAQMYLIKLVKENPNDILPMVYLANIRLKAGAYIASTEDFRALLSMYGKSNLERNLENLTFDERKEIARVHRLHGFRYLAREASYKDAAECFTVAICAINGPLAIGLLLSRGYCYMHMNDFDKAAADFKECLSQNDKLASALCARAVLYAITTHVEESLTDFHEAFTSNSISCQQCLPRLPLEHVLIFSQMLIQYVKQGIEGVVDRKNPLYSISEIDNNFNESNENHYKELDKQYLSYSHFLCQVFPKNIDYIATYVECLHLRHERTTMQVTIEQAITSFPDETILRAWNCVFLAEQRQLEEAIMQVQNLQADQEQLNRAFFYLSKKTRHHLFDRVFKKAVKSVENSKNEDALNFYNIAHMLNNTDVATIRGRMKCYQVLGETKNWLKDLTKLLQLEPTVQDYCARATYHQKQGEELKACEDFISALELNEQETKEYVIINSNSDDIVRLFQNTAITMVDLNKPKTVTRLCDAGLKFDTSHKGLLQLKERSNTNKCCIQ